MNPDRPILRYHIEYDGGKAEVVGQLRFEHLEGERRPVIDGPEGEAVLSTEVRITQLPAGLCLYDHGRPAWLDDMVLTEQTELEVPGYDAEGGLASIERSPGGPALVPRALAEQARDPDRLL